MLSPEKIAAEIDAKVARAKRLRERAKGLEDDAKTARAAAKTLDDEIAWLRQAPGAPPAPAPANTEV